MLKIVRTMRELDFGRLMQVYEEGNRENGADNYPEEPEMRQLLLAEQDFCGFLQEFFKTPGAFYAVWDLGVRYAAALRMEPYRDGLLLEALETAPDLRRRGYASLLIREIFACLGASGGVTVYSHVDKRNRASLGVHRSCGFERIAEHAVYIDGSVLQSSCTLCIKIGNG